MNDQETKTTSRGTAEEALRRVAERTSLREGPEAVRRLMEIVASEDGLPLMNVARALRLPLPVTTAVRRELEREGLLYRAGGLRLTDKGKALLKALGGASTLRAACRVCDGRRYVIPDSIRPLVEIAHKYHEAMPTVDVTLDQAFSTPETSMRRAIYMWENGDLAGRRLICLGDDDLVSISAGLLMREYGQTASDEPQIIVVDTDERILDVIRQAAEEQNLSISCVNHDLRDPLPVELADSFDTAETDPPFTVEGIRLFASRALEALGEKRGAALYLSFPHRYSTETLRIQKILSDLGLAIQEMIPDFNEYVGATILGNRSRIARLEIAGPSAGGIRGRFAEHIYSKSPGRGTVEYKCASCGAISKVGPGQKTATIESLKAIGCPECGENKFRRIGHGRP